MPRLSLYLLGPPRIESDGEPVDVDTRKAIALLAYLALTGERHRRAALVNLLWPELSEQRGRAALRRTLSTLRRAIDAPSEPTSWLDADYQSVELRRDRPDGLFWTDVDAFRGLLAQCRVHGHPESDVCAACLPLLAAAAELYRGDFLTGFTLRDSVNFDDWQFYQTDALRRAVTSALAKLARGYSAQGAYEPALRAARRWLEFDRLDEAAHVQLMRLYAQAGRRSAALRQYEECVQTLKDQLGASPQPATTALYQQILSSRLAQAGPPSRQRVNARAASEVPISPRAGAPAAMPPAAGLKRTITVLCADISSSFQPAGATSPEDEAALVERFLNLIEGALNAFGGRRARVLGGRAIIAFGLEQTHESDAERALRAALEIRRHSARKGLEVRVGVNSGEIYATELAPETLAGSVVDQAVRLAEQATPGQIRAGEVTYQLTRRLFGWTAEIEDKQPVHSLERLLARPRTGPEIDAPPPPLVGRDAEWATLQSALDRVRQREGQMVSLIGEAGVGKSRLIAELRSRVLPSATGTAAEGGMRNLLWLQGRCLDRGTAAPYEPFIDLFAQYFAWTDRVDDAERRARITAALQALSNGPTPALARSRSDEIGALLCRLLLVQPVGTWDGLPADEPPPDELPEQVRYRTFLAIRDLLLALAQRHPLVLVFEDLHWADDLSLDLISLLMESVAHTPWLLVCAYRPEPEHRSAHLGQVAARKCRDAYSELVLHELSGMQSEQLLASLLHSAPFPSSLRDVILTRAHGNPFFIEEALRALLDSQAVYRDAGRWHVREGEDLERVPKTVQNVILSRVDRLAPELRDALQIAAVIGSVFERRLLARMLHTDELDRALWALEEVALIYPERTLPRVEYSFRHALAQEAIYASLPRRRREILHGSVAETLESLYSANLDEVSEQVAYHYDRARRSARAIPYLLRAGLKARDNSANEAAIVHLSRGLELLRAEPESRACAQSAARDRQELELLLAIGIPLVLTRGPGAPEVESTYARARVLCAQGCDPSDHFQVVLGLRRVHSIRGEQEMAHRLGQELLDIAAEIEDPTYLSRAHFMQGETLYLRGEFAEALEHFEHSLSARSDDPRQRLSARFRHGNDTLVCSATTAAMVQWHLGFPDQATARLRKTLALAESLSHPFTLVYALRFAAWLGMLLRDVHATQTYSERLLALATGQRFPLFEAEARVLYGWTLAAEKRAEEARTSMQTGASALEQIGPRSALPHALTWQADALGRLGHPEEGLEAIQRALALRAGSDIACWHAEMVRVKGELLLASGMPADEAESCFRRALQTAREQDARSWELRAATSLGKLLHRQGKTAEARDLVRGIYGWFSEGFDTADLREAKALLEQWAD